MANSDLEALRDALRKQFQWLTPEQSAELTSEARAGVREEFADVLL
jgi:hypothetical protein